MKNEIKYTVAHLCWFLIHTFASGSLSPTSNEKLRSISQQTSSFGYCICFHFYYWNCTCIVFITPTSQIWIIHFRFVKLCTKPGAHGCGSSTPKIMKMKMKPENVDIAGYRSNAMTNICYNQWCMRSNKNILCNKHLFGIVQNRVLFHTQENA